MKKINSLLIIFLSCINLLFSHNNNNNVKKTALYTLQYYASNQFYVSDTTGSYNKHEFSKNLKNLLKGYNLRIYKTDKIIDGEIYFTTNYIGKSFFSDYYTVYQNDLNRHSPKPPDSADLKSAPQRAHTTYME